MVCVTALHLQVLDDLLRSPWFLVVEWLCVLVLFLSKNWMNYAVLPSPYLVNPYLVDWLLFLGFVPLLYELYFCSCNDTQAWLALVTKLVPCLAVACPAHMSCVLSYAETWAPGGAQVWSAAALILCCPGFGQAQVYCDSFTVQTELCVISANCPNWIWLHLYSGWYLFFVLQVLKMNMTRRYTSSHLV